MREERNGAAMRPRGRLHSSEGGKDGEEGKAEKEGFKGKGEGNGVVVLPSMAETVQRLLAEAGIEKRDDRVVHLLIDLLQRETLSLLADAAEIVDYRHTARVGALASVEKPESDESIAGALPAQGDEKPRPARRPAGPPSSMCIEEEDANAAVQEYTQRYVVQPSVVLDSARLCSLSNSLACGQSTAAELILHRATPTGSMQNTSPLLGEPFVLRPVDSSSTSGVPTSSGLSGSSFVGGSSRGSTSRTASSLGTHAILTTATNKHILGTTPQGLAPYLPEDVNINTLMPSWSLRSTAASLGKLHAEGGARERATASVAQAENRNRHREEGAETAGEETVTDERHVDGGAWPSGQAGDVAADIFFQKEHLF
ncbi:conserved hypothetical protein [Neospora caninum Liverpool]|uniref:Uncharacterized protein n=1 Tax=Neospora caninum (strain Liverpool) TaxID=572307 RepID=F0VQC3_NEOCL|nr:conserved hypothetical protein [Neospora caninum Liverpool]CBZ55920.1 conserved hypothetical protein [Neospora caninum Liverpool]CEL70663.1 TPA: hypothetical protein BN1204_063460 [Neospora caninum Liverpool]|eukprot:XP_003885946.1 conserved hypothetical protein [Neospora caninum Liverpool]